MNPFGDTPVIWTREENGVTVTSYWGCADLIPKEAAEYLTDTKGGPVTVPFVKSGKPATFDGKGKQLKASTEKLTVMGKAEYAAKVEAFAAARAVEIVEPFEIVAKGENVGRVNGPEAA